MAIKKCCIPKCKSSSTRSEDKGVTYHKFPKNSELWLKWASATHCAAPKSTSPSFVCSRHFCKDDFKKNKDSKYVLKSDAIPSIFSWEVDNLNMEDPLTTENEAEHKNTNTSQDENGANTSISSKESDSENLEAIKQFIEAQEKGIQQNNPYINERVENPDINLERLLGSTGKPVAKPVDNVENDQNEEIVKNEVIAEDFKYVQQPVSVDEDTMAVASSVIEMMLNETEANAMKNKAEKDRPNVNPGSSNMPLSVGSKVEAKDFSEEWYPAEIAEVDFDEMEVLVHYENAMKKSDEWISVSSPRLRPFNVTACLKPVDIKPPELQAVVKEEPIKDIKVEDKSKMYAVGERCLARWRDNRRFVATIVKDLADGRFEVIFDDGVHWTCSAARLSKLKDLKDPLSIDTAVQPMIGTPSPVQQGGPTSGSQSPVFNTHLFDPTRDYLGSKSERREKKRKLNIKEIFNIGQKKPKTPKIEKEKVPKDKKADVKNVKQKVSKTPPLKVKTGIPDAVASIIGTITKDEIKTEVQSPEAEPMDVDDFDIQREESQEADDSDTVDEEDKLERFDKPDLMHEEVIDKIKEAIIKLEGGLNESAYVDHKKHSVKLEVAKPKPEIKTQVIDTAIPVIDLQKPDTPKPDAPKPEVDTLETFIDTLNPVTEIPESVTNISIHAIDDGIVSTNETTENLSAETDDENTGIESPRVDLETSEADFNFSLDSDATVSDIEMGNDSPRIEIDSQNIPILVDIDAPLDDDPNESQSEDKSALALPQERNLEEPTRKSKKKLKKSKRVKVDDAAVQAEVERVKSELDAIKLKVDDMKAKMRRKKQIEYGVPLPESCLLPGEWACHWVNGQPVGKVSEMVSDARPDATGQRHALPRRSVEVQDKRLPAGWSKHMVRRSVGHSAGKWDVVLISPSNKRFHTKTDMRNFLETSDEATRSHEYALLDFGVHLKLARKLGWIASTPDGIAEEPETILPAGSFSATSPLVKKKKLNLKRRGVKLKDKKRPIKLKLQRGLGTYASKLVSKEAYDEQKSEATLPSLEDGYVWVGSLKVQVIENLLRCPADGCFKNFRNNTLLQMHIKHYHRELCQMMGATPKVLDLAAARTKPTAAKQPRLDPRIIRVKINRPQKREEPPVPQDIQLDTPTKPEERKIPRSQDSPKLRNALNKPAKRPRVLLPMRRPDPEAVMEMPESMQDDESDPIEPSVDAPEVDVCDFETAISTHTVTKPADKRKGNKKQKSFAAFSKNTSEDEEWFAMNSDDVETRSSFPRSGTPDSKTLDLKPGLHLSSDLIEEHSNDPSSYTLTENGEKVKIVHMKREEIINCHCGFREEDGLMVQCELCLCWQHALCHNIQRECDVPEKYTCSICVNPRRGRRGARFLHDQDRLYEGLLPAAKPSDSLRRSHELSGNLLRIQDALHALRLKYYVATKKDHPKLYLWAKDWEETELTYKLNSDYSDLNIMINGMDKENLPLKPDEPSLLDIRTPSSEDQDDRYSQREGSVGSQALLSGLLSSPSAASLELPISTSELERLAKTVQEAAAEWQGQASAPQPEAAIDNEVCRERLLNHIQRCQALLDSRLDSIEAQVAELESQEPSFGDHYETAEHYPRIKQTVQMLMRDLDTMEELGVIT